MIASWWCSSQFIVAPFSSVLGIYDLSVTGDPALLAPAITPPGAPEHDLPPAVCGPNGPRWSLNSVPVDAALYWSRQLARVPTLRLAL